MPVDGWAEYEGPKRHVEAGDYTTSLDAAVALVERVPPPEWTAWRLELRSRRRKTAFVAELARLPDDPNEDEICITAHAKSPAAALVLALVRAVMARGDAE